MVRGGRTRRALVALGTATIAVMFLTLPAASVPPEGTMLTLTWTAPTLYSVDPSDAATTPVGASSLSDSTGIAWDPTTGTLFGVDWNLHPDHLYTIDPDTGSATQVAQLSVDRPTGLDVDPSTGVLYVVYDDDDEGGSILGTIDKATGAVTPIGPTLDEDERVRLSAIAVSPVDGTMYGYSYNNRFYSIDTSNGELSHLAIDTAPDIYGLAFDCDGTLYGTDTDVDGELYTIDVETGDVATVGFMDLDGDFTENLTVICSIEPPPTTTTSTTPTSTSTTSTTVRAATEPVTPRFTG